MQIHDLNTKTLTNPAYVPFDDGTDTYKAEFNEVVSDAAADAVADADLTDNEVAFTSGDALSPTAWTDVALIETGSTLATLFNKISTMIKNVRWLYSKIMGHETATCTITTGSGTISLVKSGNVVLANVNKVNTSVAAQTSFGTIPAEFRPYYNAYCPLSYPTDGTMISFSTSGNLTLNKATTNNMYGSVTYIV